VRGFLVTGPLRLTGRVSDNPRLSRNRTYACMAASHLPLTEHSRLAVAGLIGYTPPAITSRRSVRRLPNPMTVGTGWEPAIAGDAGRQAKDGAEPRVLRGFAVSGSCRVETMASANKEA
jgi:hypothetical protein